MENHEIFTSVTTILAVDGCIDAAEMQFLQSVRGKLGISVETANTVVAEAKQGKRKIHLPSALEEKRRLLSILVLAALANGIIDPKERQALVKITEQLALPPDELDVCIARQAKTTSQTGRNVEQSEAPSMVFSVSPPPPQTTSPPRLSVMKTCPACGYRATTDDDPLLTAHDGRGECPKCGIVVRQYKRMQKRKEREGEGASSKADKKKKGREKAVIVLLEFYALAILIAVFTCFSLPMWRVRSALKQNEIVPATLLSVELEEAYHDNTSNIPGGGTSYTLEIEYEYEYKGRIYQSTRVSMLPPLLDDTHIKWYKRLKPAYDNKQSVDCYVSITKPSIAALDPKLPLSDIIVPSVALFMIITFAGVFWVIGVPLIIKVFYRQFFPVYREHG